MLKLGYDFLEPDMVGLRFTCGLIMDDGGSFPMGFVNAMEVAVGSNVGDAERVRGVDWP